MACGRRRLFIYYRVRLADADTAIAVAQQMQRSLCDGFPGLQAALMRRPDADNNAELTLMETYALDAAVAAHGIDADLHARIETAARAALGGFICGVRHVEVFDACA